MLPLPQLEHLVVLFENSLETLTGESCMEKGSLEVALETLQFCPSSCLLCAVWVSMLDSQVLHTMLE